MLPVSIIQEMQQPCPQYLPRFSGLKTLILGAWKRQQYVFLDELKGLGARNGIINLLEDGLLQKLLSYHPSKVFLFQRIW
ncbi:hypothetical protein GGP99_003411 [Salinibacter ruber]|uniref:Uncharacterized protein n=1 Tax=Salinibacter ruber TaxID=146919 RepID=A0AAW5PC11_9BACT|nr:hypothetical protein [Salinibacter ruber]MCS4223683.1 hypothetical protein [Salinibacter ruber]